MSELTLDPLSRPAENGPVSSVWAGIKSWLQPKHPLDGETMLKYFIYQLQVRTKLVAPRIANDNEKEELLDFVRTELFSFYENYESWCPHLVDDAWNHAYYLERLLALIEPTDTLIGEVQRRLHEAADEKVPAAPRLRADFDALASQIIDMTKTPPRLKPDCEPRMRAMLLDILEEIHWTFQRKFHARPIQKSATRRLVTIGLIACSLFVLPYAHVYIETWVRGSNNYDLPLGDWAWLPLWTALTAGFFGAMFSRLLFLQTNWNALSLGAVKDARDYNSILLRGAVGMTGAVVIYFFLLSGIIGGGLFPEFKKIALHQLSFYDPSDGDGAVALRLILPNAQLALLVVWSFLAGFSERLVPSILQTTEASLGESAAPRRMVA